MLAIYRSLLHLYPASYQERFGREMIEVLGDLQVDARKKGPVALAVLWLGETTGLVFGAVREHFHSAGRGHVSMPISFRRFTMHRDYRFPKSTPVLMTLILGGVVLAIEKAKAIQASLPDVNPPIGPIQPAHHTFLPGIAALLLGFYAVGLLGWVILYALRRSGVHRLAEMVPGSK